MVFASRIVSGYVNAYSTAQTAVLRCLGADFLPGEKERPMQRRTFMNLSAGAATALAFKPWALAMEHEQKNLVVYPDPAIEVIDPRFAKYKVINAAVERLYTGTRWAEGPVWFGDGRYLLLSDIPNNRILRWLEDTGEVSVFRKPFELQQWQLPGSARPASHLRTRHAPGHANRIRWHHHRSY